MDLGDYKKEYPGAKLIAVEEAIKKKTEEGLVFDGGMYNRALLKLLYLTCREQAWGADPAGTKYGFEDDVCILILSVM